MRCEHLPACPGCPLAASPYAQQLIRKRARLAAALALYPHLPPAPPVLGSQRTEGYRHRVKLPVQVAGRRVAIGLYDPNGGRVVDSPTCPVLEPGLRAALAEMRPWLANHSEVHSVDLRRSSANGQLQLVLAVKGGDLKGGRKEVGALVHLLPELTSVALSVADPTGRRVMGAAPRLVHGQPTLDEAIGRTRYRIHPGAFFQVDPQQAAVLHDLVRVAVGKARSVLDLYAGVGAYALMLAPGRTRVLAVEEVPQAAASAAAMAPANMKVVAARVEDLGLEGRFDVGILNPARRGSDPAVLAQLARLCRRLIYVSCGPETLARDLDILAFHGMRVANIQALDLFPQTPEVETVVTLDAGAPLERWAHGAGQAQSPWGGAPSGAVGKPERATALLLGDTGHRGDVGAARFERIAALAGHSLVRLDLKGTLEAGLAGMARRGHAVAGEDPKTTRFFAEKAGLLRPFLHINRAGGVDVPLHGDLVTAIERLQDAPRQSTKAGARRPAGRRRR